jgi:von Willebrand factor A domain-containing protein 7
MFDIPALGFKPFHIVIAILSLYTLQASSFMPSDSKEFYFGDGGISHQTQTKNAYDQLVQNYFGGIKTSTTMETARKEFADANMAVDDDQGQSALHFDGENFEGGQARLVQQKALAYSAILANDGSSARQYLGGALHTVQDFYAHSNWVEQQVAGGILDINHDLGISGATIGHADINTATCTECLGLDTQANLLKLCLDCSANVPPGLLTSGYYYGEDSPGVDPLTGKQVSIPSYKCHHGKSAHTQPYYK